jgi:hypothetical protein
MQLMQPHEATVLYWSIRGDVSCVNHAPATSSPLWNRDKWARIPDTSTLGLRGRPRYQCQWCADDGLALIRYSESVPTPLTPKAAA